MQLPALRLAPILTLFCFALPIVALVAPKGVLPLLILAAAAGLAATLREGRRPALPDLTLLLAAAAFFVWCGLAASWSFAPPEAFLRALRVAAVLAVGILFCSLTSAADEDTRQRCGNALFAGLAIAYALALFDTMSGSALFNLVKGSTGTAYHDASRLNRGVTAMTILVWPLVALLWRSGWSWRCLVLPLALLVFSLFTEASAGSFALAVALLAVAIALPVPLAGRLVVVASLLLAFVASAPFATLAHDAGWSRADWLFGSAQHRIYIWNFVAERIAEQPVSGWGFAASRDMPNFGVPPHAGGAGSVIPLHPHNAALQILLELGIIGALISLAMLWSPLRFLERLPRPARACGQAMFVAILTIASTAYGIWQNHWLALILGAAAVFMLLAPRGAVAQAPDQSGKPAASASDSPSTTS